MLWTGLVHPKGAGGGTHVHQGLVCWGAASVPTATLQETRQVPDGMSSPCWFQPVPFGFVRRTCRGSVCNGQPQRQSPLLLAAPYNHHFGFFCVFLWGEGSCCRCLCSTKAGKAVRVLLYSVSR